MALSAEAKELRAGRLTGTTTAAALGLHPYITPLQVFEQITGLHEIEPNEAMEWGLEFEEPIARRYARQRGLTIERLDTRQHKSLEYWAASGDFRLSNGQGLEVKTTGRDHAGEWGDENTDAIPYPYLVQVAVQMAVFDEPLWNLAVCIGGQEGRSYVVHRDTSLEELLAAQSAAFFRDYIRTGNPPPARSDGEFLAYLKHQFPQDDGLVVESTPEIDAAVTRLMEARAVLKEAEEIKEREEAVIKAHMGAGSVLATSACKSLTWKTAKGTSVTDWQTLALGLGATADQIRDHTTMRQGSRRFLPR